MNLSKLKFWLLAGGAALVLIALAITGFTEKGGRPAAGSHEQLAAAREAKKRKADQEKESTNQDDEKTISENNE